MDKIKSNARLKNRARIETSWVFQSFALQRVTPGLKTGRGLKHQVARRALEQPRVTPGLKTGRGLKLVDRGRNHTIS